MPPTENDTGELKVDIDDQNWAETLLAGENRLLKMIAKGDSLTVILDELCRLFEEISSGFLASILLLDANGNRLWHGAAPSLPKNYTEAIDGALIGPAAGSCGTAAFLGEPVIVSDIATDPLWADYRELALPHGLRGCWSTPIFATDGNVLGTFAIYSRDVRSPSPEHHNLIEQITHLATIAVERKRAEEKLRQSERELRQIIEAIPHHIFVLGPDGSRLYSNRVAREYHGLNPDDPQEDRPAMFVHPEDRERVLADRERLIARGEPYEMEARLRGKDGQYRWFLIRGNPLRDEKGRIVRWYGTRTDIEDRKRAEEKLRQDERELRQITDAIPQAICVLAPDGTILYANEVVLDYTGLALEDVKGEDFRQRLFHPEDLETLRDERKQALSRGEPFETELRARRSDGQYRWFLIRYNPLRDDDGRILRWYATGMDIEDRKQAEERIQKENLALREEIDHSSMFEEIVGSSEALRKVLAQVAKARGRDVERDGRARLDLGEIEQIVDEREQMASTALNCTKLLFLLWRQRAGKLHQQRACEADDRIERRAQLMRHVRQELGLVLRRESELRGLFFQFLLGQLDFAILPFDFLVLPRQQARFRFKLFVGLLQFLLAALKFARQRLRLLEELLGAHVRLDRIEHDADRFRQLIKERLCNGVDFLERSEFDDRFDLAFEEHRQDNDVTRRGLAEARRDVDVIFRYIHQQDRLAFHGALPDKPFAELDAIAGALSSAEAVARRHLQRRFF
jgi:PAS domain S-box-containing protein